MYPKIETLQAFLSAYISSEQTQNLTNSGEIIIKRV